MKLGIGSLLIVLGALIGGDGAIIITPLIAIFRYLELIDQKVIKF